MVALAEPLRREDCLSPPETSLSQVRRSTRTARPAVRAVQAVSAEVAEMAVTARQARLGYLPTRCLEVASMAEMAETVEPADKAETERKEVSGAPPASVKVGAFMSPVERSLSPRTPSTQTGHRAVKAALPLGVERAETAEAAALPVVAGPADSCS
jgi:hypothetical protein